MLSNGHVDSDARLHGEAEVARTGFDRLVHVVGRPGLLWIDTAVDCVIFAAPIREEGEVSERGKAASSRIVHVGEACDL